MLNCKKKLNKGGDSIKFIYEAQPEVSSYVDDLKNNGASVVMRSRKNYFNFAINFQIPMHNMEERIINYF